eukprot:m.211407 g.211407  ORF g.211407 m.211407 type:complete len:107 (+) comp19029_c0_seq1:359-679(+)
MQYRWASQRNERTMQRVHPQACDAAIHPRSCSGNTCRKCFNNASSRKYEACNAPPTGRTVPDNVISPVIAVSFRAMRLLRSDANAVTNVTPADGPSFPTAPSGKWM